MSAVNETKWSNPTELTNSKATFMVAFFVGEVSRAKKPRKSGFDTSERRTGVCR